MVSFDPDRPDFAPYGLTCVRWRPAPMLRPDHHNEVELNFLETGWVTYLLGGRKVRVDAGRLHAFWAAIPHQIIDYGDELEYFVATIPLPWFLQCRLPDTFTQRLLGGQMITEPTAERSAMDRQYFSDWEQDLEGDAPIARQRVLLEMHARLLRLATTVPTERDPRIVNGRNRHAALTEVGLTKVEQMACLIATRYTEKLTVKEIGTAVSLHPNYAMNLFQKHFGTTLIEYLTQHRLFHAQRLLATTDMKVVHVAFESGFGSLSRFNEAFLAACGCTPREYRRQHALEE